MAHIKLKGVEFSYPVFQVANRSIKFELMRNIVGSRLVSRPNRVDVQALAGVDLEIKEGERLGIIGRNGSGKSTLLRMLAGLIRPDAGEVDVQGRVVSTITRGLGLTLERTGRQNIELPLRLLGATSEEVRDAKLSVPEWTGLGGYIDLPMRTYSAGMRSRLTFAISTSIKGDILILDEWMSAGDADFVNKARQRLKSVMSQSGIVVLCTHSMRIIETMCTSVCWLDQGRVVMTGHPRSVINAYKRSSLYVQAHADEPGEGDDSVADSIEDAA